MVFLFISFIVIVFIFITPFKVGLSLFTDKNRQNIVTSIKISFFTKYLSKINHQSKNKSNKIFNVLPFKINFNKNPFQIIKSLIIPDKLLIEIRTTSLINPALLYPIKGFFLAIYDYLDYSGYDSVFFFNIINAEESYFESQFEMKVNLFMIFSILFQIIRIEIRRKKWK